MRAGELLVLPVAILLVGALLAVAWLNRPEPAPPPPDFAAFTDVKQKKAAFFQFVLPMIRQSNEEVRQERARLRQLSEKRLAQETLTEKNEAWLRKLAIKYRVVDEDPLSLEGLQHLKRRVDIVPASLAMAQAANESGWGTARFARNGNNYYGLWCWSENCGLVPDRREVDARHEVASFETPVDSVRYYMLTLNSHPAYQQLRTLRSESRTKGEPLSGRKLAAGLLRYSERGEAYVDELRAMIRVNRLQQYNL